MGHERELAGLTGALQARDIEAHLLAARARTLALTRDLEPAQWIGPRLPIVNPPLWELGHVGWFQEYWCLRRQPDDTVAPARSSRADSLYDSTTVAHDTRWSLPLWSRADTQRYLGETLELTLERLAREPDNPRVRYFAELAAAHEDMHGEALHHTRQTLGYAPPTLGAAMPWRQLVAPASGDVAIDGGTFMLGAYPEAGFVFDNEKWAYEITLEPFAIARTPVTNGQFRAFVESGGYQTRALWSAEGWHWLKEIGPLAPRYWRRMNGAWLERRFDRLQPIEEDAPIVNVNFFEAEAYCAFARRRLPTEAEWECAATRAPSLGRKALFPWGEQITGRTHANLDGQWVAPVDAYPAGDSGDGCRQMLGNVWEWTASTFAPYPGFVRDPYQEYSEPWFGTHKVLRGGSFATPARLIRSTWRNFYQPHRNDPFAGFRTCALD